MVWDQIVASIEHTNIAFAAANVDKLGKVSYYKTIHE